MADSLSWWLKHEWPIAIGLDLSSFFTWHDDGDKGVDSSNSGNANGGADHCEEDIFFRITWDCYILSVYQPHLKKYSWNLIPWKSAYYRTDT